MADNTLSFEARIHKSDRGTYFAVIKEWSNTTVSRISPEYEDAQAALAWITSNLPLENDGLTKICIDWTVVTLQPEDLTVI